MLDVFTAQMGGLVAAHDLCALWAKANGEELACDSFVLNAEENSASVNAKGADIKLVILRLDPGM